MKCTATIKIGETQGLINNAIRTGEGFAEAIASYNDLSSEEKSSSEPSPPKWDYGRGFQRVRSTHASFREADCLSSIGAKLSNCPTLTRTAPY